MRQSPKPRLIKSSFRLSAELDQMIRATASATDRTPSELVRDAVAAYLGQDATGGRKMARRRPTPPPVDPALLRQVAMIGNNLNQIARTLNAAAKTNEVGNVIGLLGVLVSIDQQCKSIFPQPEGD
jgi:hypothetical protein